MSVTRWIWGSLGCVSLIACGSSGGAPSPSGTATSEFAPPPAPEGYTRITAPVIDGIGPAGDVLRCQYVLAPFDRDVDVLDIQGYQSQGGHHAIAYAVKNSAPLGTSRECNAEDNTNIGGFLGGIGGDGGGKATLPDGVVFRLTQGSSVMLNTHFLNTSSNTVDGYTVLDIKFDEVDPSRKVASIFVNVTMDFTVAPLTTSSVDATCTVPHDLQFLSFTNHMHSYGVRSETVLMHPSDTTGETVHTDPTWTPEMQFNPIFTNWTLDAPYLVKQGDTLRTHCEWDNSTSNAITFPDEMCVSFGFFLTNSSSSPICLAGSWSE